MPRMPAALQERAAAFARGDADIVVPPAEPASTVVLLGAVDGDIVTYLMRRTSTMAFAAGMHVFPGGRIDAADRTPDITWVRDVDAAPMSADPDLARALVVGAVRELFEETGILLAVDPAGRIPSEDAEWEDDRRAVAADSATLPGILTRRGLALDPALLPLWTHWVTPEIETRRYDVRFFVARVPEGQTARDVSGEADHVRWIRPSDALGEYSAGRLMMLPPTVATIADLVPLTSLDDLGARAASRTVRPLMPRPRLDDAGRVHWDLIDARDGTVVMEQADEPAGSEVHGVHADTGPADR